ncbi:MAG: PAN domain-containing protein [Xanthobacteraceae bacterium]
MWSRFRLSCLLILLLSAVHSVPAAAQVGYDRWGGDYASFSLRSGDPAQCAARCERDSRCRAWAFSYPATESTNAVCWLKSRVTPRFPASCCVSGVRGAGVIEPRSGPTEFAIDRMGGDYRHFELPPDPSGTSCQLACEADEACRAWTYLRPGYVGAAARCYLKDRITRPRRRPCCISGVVR